jgi:hypothetical protein
MTNTLVHEAIDFLTGNCGPCPPTLVMRTGIARPPVKATPTRCASGPATNRQPGRAVLGKGFTRLPDQPAILPASAVAARAGLRARPRASAWHRTLEEGMNTYATLPARTPRGFSRENVGGWVSDVLAEPTPCPTMVFEVRRKNVRGSFAGI